MSLFIPRRVPRNWYRYHVIFSLELMRVFVDITERQIKESIQRYLDKAGTTFREKDFGSGIEVSTEIHDGLDDETWDLNSIFEIHFPNLQRRSALITLFSFLETELDELCRLYSEDLHCRITIKDMSGKGIERSTVYLEKVAGLRVGKSTPLWRELTSIQKIRNVIVHQNGKLRSMRGERDVEIDRFIRETPTLGGDEEVVIMEGFLYLFIEKIDQYFKFISESIKSAVWNK